MATPPRGLVVAVVVAVAVLALIVTLVLRGEADRSTTGRVAEVDDRRICVASGEERQCARVDRPPLVAGVRSGDCVEMRRSADGILEQIAPAVEC
jgi:hypothetical protein